MSANATTTNSLSRGDRASLVGFMLAGAVIIVWTTVVSVLRIVDLVRGTDVPVSVEFIDDTVPVPYGSSGEAIDVAIERGTVVADLSATAATAGVIGQIMSIVTSIVVVGCLVLLAVGILRGRVFSRRHTGLVMTAGLVGIIGFAAVPFFDNMVANAVVADLTDNELNNAILSVEPFVFVLAAFVIATIGTAFTVGHRLQRDTEGLV